MRPEPSGPAMCCITPGSNVEAFLPTPTRLSVCHLYCVMRDRHHTACWQPSPVTGHKHATRHCVSGKHLPGRASRNPSSGPHSTLGNLNTRTNRKLRPCESTRMALHHRPQTRALTLASICALRFHLRTWTPLVSFACGAGFICTQSPATHSHGQGQVRSQASGGGGEFGWAGMEQAITRNEMNRGAER